MNDPEAKPRNASNHVHTSNSNLRLTARFGPCSPAPPFKGYPRFSGQPLHRNEYGRYRLHLGGCWRGQDKRLDGGKLRRFVKIGLYCRTWQA
jgi:hypothetical protein